MSQRQNPSASAINPRGDVSFIRATPTGPPQPVSPTSSREKNMSTSPHPQQGLPPSGAGGKMPWTHETGISGIGWSEREEMLSHELEEARVRVAQMEKTMRWWSDCTANWRDKWNKARNERNKAREENRILRARLDAVVKECSALKWNQRDKLTTEQELLAQCSQSDVGNKQPNSANKEVSENNSVKDVIGVTDGDLKLVIKKIEKEKIVKDTDEKDTDDTEGKHSVNKDVLVPSEMMRPRSWSNRTDSTVVSTDENANSEHGSNITRECVSHLKIQLDEAQRTIEAHHYEKDTLSRTIDQLAGELSSLRVTCDEIKQSKQELVNQKPDESLIGEEIGMAKMREDHESQLGQITLDLEDESTRSSSMDRRLTELQRELEHLQAENASEWAKRERLETEKQTLERENRKLRSNITDMEDQLQRKHQAAAASIDVDLRTLQFDVAEKNKELTELRHTQNKLRKTLGERTTELEHSRRRADQYETEVKKLRGRVEELKRDLAAAEDEVDMQTNSVRRLQRTNDELQEQVDNLTVQLDHLQNRLRRSSQPLPKTRSASLKSFTLDDPANLADSEDDIEDS